MLYSSQDDHILVLLADGRTKDIAGLSELLGTEMVDKVCSRYFLFVQRDMEASLPPL